MSPQNQAFMQGKADYRTGKSLEDNPYNVDVEMSSNWVEGYQMASYEERPSGISINNH